METLKVQAQIRQNAEELSGYISEMAKVFYKKFT